VCGALPVSARLFNYIRISDMEKALVPVPGRELITVNRLEKGVATFLRSRQVFEATPHDAYSRNE
jgi:hypothetical protein